MNNILPFRTFDRNDFQPVDYVLDTTDSESECVEDMFGRFGFANRATREPSQSSLSRPYGRVSTIACVALSVLTIAYFAAEFLR